MQKYFNNVVNSLGVPVAGASVLVTKLTGGAASLFTDNGVTRSTNPVSTNGSGQFSFYAPDGRYTLTVTGNGILPYSITDLILDDPFGGGSGAVFTTITSVAPTGTAPLIVASTTPVANLTASNVVTNANLTGDVTSVGNVTTLATANATVGTYGTATSVSQFTADAKGRITGAVNVPIAIANTAVSGLGTLSTQNATAVAITGGTINSTPLGATTASSARITTFQVAEGANAKSGTAVLVAGTVTVANTGVTAVSRIQLTSQLDGGTLGFLRVSARTAGTSFVITSSSATDTSTVAYLIVEPA